MKIYKLLFLFVSLISLNSCVEYVDNGSIPADTQFKAKLKEGTAKYVGDIFTFESSYLGADVTLGTNFKVDGVDLGEAKYTYKALKEGDHNVMATFEIPNGTTKTASFKFTVLKKETTPNPEPEPEPEPEPVTGNRIEYNGQSYPVSNTIWILNGTQTAEGISAPITTIGSVNYTEWLMVSTDNLDSDLAQNMYYTMVYVPVTIQGQNFTLKFPYEVNPVFKEGEGFVVVGATDYDMGNATYTFAASGNTQPVQSGQTYIGTANYTSNAALTNSTTAKLFWNGNYFYGVDDLSGGAKGAAGKSITPTRIDASKIKFYKKN